MASANRFGLSLAWLGGLVFTLIGIYKNQPVLIHLRGAGTVVMVATSVAVIAWLARYGYWKRAGLAGRWLLALWFLPLVSMLSAQASFEDTRQSVLQTEPSVVQSLGRHFMVGYSDFDEVARLAEKGLIAGIYISKGNVAQRKPGAVSAEIAALPARRLKAGVPPLVVAADQEGGIVSHLSPPLTRLPPLSSLAGLSPEARVKEAEEFGRIHGRELASLGVTTNFAPVL